jgi:cation diffusion facilitator CzcD-associated flavoprotein CzcO
MDADTYTARSTPPIPLQRARISVTNTYPSWGVVVVVTNVAIIGAGPYGLSVAAHLRSLGVSYRIFGTPIDTWRRHIPAGMLLKSDGFASSLSDPDGKGTLAAYCMAEGIPYHDTAVAVKLDVFNAYALDFQQRFVPDVEDRQVVSLKRVGERFELRLDDGEDVSADAVVGAVGITHFNVVPDELTHLPSTLASHSSAHHDLSSFAGRSVIVVGGGSSAVDIATLLAEAGATVSLIARRDSIRFSSVSKSGHRIRWQRLRHPSSGLGPGWRSWLCQNVPSLFRFLPGNARLTIIRRHLGPQAAGVMKARFEAGVSVALGTSVARAVEDNGRVRLTTRAKEGTEREVLADHVIAATGYRPDVDRLPFLSDSLRADIRTHSHMPVLSKHFESSVPRLYFVGPPAVNTFGPLMRFMVGAEYAAPVVAHRLRRQVGPSDPARTMASA